MASTSSAATTAVQSSTTVASSSTLPSSSTTTTTTTTTTSSVAPSSSSSSSLSSSAASSSSSTTAATTAGSTATSSSTGATTITSTTTATTTGGGGGGGSSVNWALVGGIVGGIAGVILIVGLISFVTRANRQTRRKRDADQNFDALYNATSASSALSNPRINQAKANGGSPPPRNGTPVHQLNQLPLDQQQQQAYGNQANQVNQPVYVPSAAFAYPPQQQQQPYPQQQQLYFPQQQQPQQQQQQEPDYTAQWQQYFAENPGSYEAYLAQQQQQQQLQYGGGGAVAVAANVVLPDDYNYNNSLLPVAPQTNIADVNAADYDTYEQFAAAQQARILPSSDTIVISHAETVSSPVLPTVPIVTTTVSTQPRSAEELEYEERLKAKIAKENEAVGGAHGVGSSSSVNDADDAVPAYTPRNGSPQ
ncbi:hypothetical protein HK100_008401 [Physocladia obscura]|uniref:Uncharacterized protein n=1 Tax=Physocladia obscura TaxID=109957 RepID=A0AAD5SQF8_9FUNG|nr:hypothetical protein HK100_008401 [Physocladia obscura]